MFVETELKKLKKFDAAYFKSKNYLDMYRYFKAHTENNFILFSSWESKRLSNEKIGSTKTSNYDQSPRLAYDNARIKLNFIGDLLKQDKITYSNGRIVNIYVVYKLPLLMIQVLL